eukprot:10982218-Lingulodinium_polyedra.AAC.1
MKPAKAGGLKRFEGRVASHVRELPQRVLFIERASVSVDASEQRVNRGGYSRGVAAARRRRAIHVI